MFLNKNKKQILFVYYKTIKMQINIFSILYISFRLAPFILVCFFSISSIFNQDLKGLFYLCGLLIASFFAIIIGNSFKSTFETNNDSEDKLYNNVTKTCNILTLTESGPLSLIPLSLIVFLYTFAYIGTIIVKYNLVTQNIPIFIIFPLLIFADIYWIFINDCFKPAAIFVALILGTGIGIGWAFAIDRLKITKLQYFNGLSNKEFCSIPSKQTFKCKPKV